MGRNPYTDGFLVLKSPFRVKWLFQTTWSDRKRLADHFRRMACYFDAAPFKIRRNVFKWNQGKQGKAVVSDTHSYVVQIAAWFPGFIQRNYGYGWSLWNDLLIDYIWLKNSFLIKHLVIFLRNQARVTTLITVGSLSLYLAGIQVSVLIITSSRALLCVKSKMISPFWSLFWVHFQYPR